MDIHNRKNICYLLLSTFYFNKLEILIFNTIIAEKYVKVKYILNINTKSGVKYENIRF